MKINLVDRYTKEGKELYYGYDDDVRYVLEVHCDGYWFFCGLHDNIEGLISALSRAHAGLSKTYEKNKKSINKITKEVMK